MRAGFVLKQVGDHIRRCQRFEQRGLAVENHRAAAANHKIERKLQLAGHICGQLAAASGDDAEQIARRAPSGDGGTVAVGHNSAPKERAVKIAGDQFQVNIPQ